MNYHYFLGLITLTKIAYRVWQFLVAVHDPVARKPMTLVIGGIATILYIEFIFV
ncbi:hypothetical protein FACI_IFERC00001G0458 [Ferroplasma acidarmanus Fer1]|uniref:Uncharacterized protein n=1 Tax=Ferroplasma acidarmanus Fer1 TaxID=333146 RepID=S0AMC7_FERAC|nr:hypothetical protein FACI_IFERC00001G0458 [Ferroplasma acidarmanus Fer1]